MAGPAARLQRTRDERARGPAARARGAEHGGPRTPQISSARRSFLRLRSDRHGTPTIEADHDGCRSGYGGLPLDSHAVWSYWRPTEGALREAMGEPFTGYAVFCNEPGAACDAARDQGRWSDGVAVASLENAADLGL